MNPYAAPQAAPPQGNPSVTPGSPQPWDVGDVIRSGWELYKAHWAPVTFGFFVVTLIQMVPGQVAPGLAQAGAFEPNSTEYWAVHGPLTVVGWLIGEFFAAGFTRATLRVTRTGAASFGDFFGAGSRYFSYLGMSFLRQLGVLLGLIVFIVPGVILALGLWLAPFYVIDQNMGPVASLKASWDASEGQKGSLFVLALAEMGVTMLGLVACCFGMFAAIPVMMIARTIVYMKMSGTAPEPPGGPQGPYGGGGFGGPPGYGPPGGYSGPPGYAGPPGY